MTSRLAARPPESVVLRLARPYIGRLLGAGLLAAGTELAGLALMATATWLLMSAAGRPPLDRLTVAIVAVRALAIGRGGLRYTERLAGHDAVLRIVAEVRARIFAALVARRGPAEHRSGDALSRMVSDVDSVQDLLLRVGVPAAAAATVGLVAAAGAVLVSPTAGLALAGGLVLASVLLPALATALTRQTAARLAPLRGALAVDAGDLISGAADLAAFGATARALGRADARSRQVAQLERRLAAVGWTVDAAGVLVAGATSATVVVMALRAGVDGVLVGVLAVGTLAAVEAALALVGAARQWAQLRPGLRRVTDLLHTAPVVSTEIGAPEPAAMAPVASTEIGAPEPATGPETGGATLAGGHAARIDRVTVVYRPGSAPALDGVSIDLPPGRRVAVVGPSGAGKSTLLAVLTGAVAPTAGRVTLDATDVATYPPERLPRLIGGLLADAAHIFHTTARENILLGRPTAADVEVAAAARTAGLQDWVRQQPDGWETVVGEGGSQLSGGQRQRLTLARALLAAPAILLLDEPTEGLDPSAADAVLHSVLASVPADRSVVLVTHRLRGLAGIDEVIVLDSGRVAQRGRHADLVERPGWYRDQWLIQDAAERGYLAVGP